MSKRLKISQPTVINTELEPLTDSFDLIASGSLQQWYNPITNTWAPNRYVTPLSIRPDVYVIDQAGEFEGTPEFQCKWFITDPSKNWDSYQMQRGNMSSQAGYILSGNNLLINKNVTDPASGVTIRCVVTYLDPRDDGRQYTLERSCDLSVNIEAVQNNPRVTIQSPQALTYNPLSETQSSRFTLNAHVDWDGGTPTGDYKFIWKTLNGSGNEAEISQAQQPYFVSKTGEHDETLMVDAMHGENIPILLYMKLQATDTNTINSYDVCNILWKVPPFDAIVACDNGNMVKLNSSTFKFHTIINLKDKTLSEEKAKSEFLFEWKKRLVTARSANPETNNEIHDNEETVGWGYEIEIPAYELKNATTDKNGSALVYSNVYLLGRYETVMSGNEAIKYDGEDIYCRT